MFAFSRVFAPLLLPILFLGASHAPAQGINAPAAPLHVTQLEKRATALLDRAVKHIEAVGEAGATAFSRDADFVDRDLYVYAFRIDGHFLASGGYSASLIGTNILDFTDTDGKPFFREIIDIALSKGRGRVEYRWFNPADSRGEPKVTLFRKVGNVIVAVGYYSPRATPIQARTMLKAATLALQSDPKTALLDFQKADGRFVRDDLYVFVVDLEKGHFLAHGANPALIGTDANLLQDINNQYIVAIMINALKNKESGELKYEWVNPISGKSELKHTYFRAVGSRLVGVGYYSRKR